MDTERGYRESLMAGDSVALATLEYRVRVSDWCKRAARPERPDGARVADDPAEALRSRGVSTEADRESARGLRPLGAVTRYPLPLEVGVRGFVDGGWVVVHRGTGDPANEGGSTLMGAGVRVDVLFRGAVKGMVRTDLGVALSDHPGGRPGASRLHVSVSLVW